MKPAAACVTAPARSSADVQPPGRTALKIMAALAFGLLAVALWLCYWDSAIRMFRSSPFTGVGPAQFIKHYVMVRPDYSDERLPTPTTGC